MEELLLHLLYFSIPLINEDERYVECVGDVCEFITVMSKGNTLNAGWQELIWGFP